jgi:hypothetical protein
MKIQAKARNLFEEAKVNFSNPEAKFVACKGLFHRSEARACFRNVKVGVR